MKTTSSRQTLIVSAADSSAVPQAVACLEAGEVVGLPTETVYGLAADATRASAVARIFAAKDRPLSDPLIVHLPSPEWLEKITLLAGRRFEAVRRVITQFWPGPLTLVLPRRPGVIGDEVTAGNAHVAVRMSAHPVFRAVIEELNLPLAAPSANRFGRMSPTTAAHVFTELSGRIPLILDGGPTQHGLESTIIAPDDDGKSWRILRHGPVTAEMLSGCGLELAGQQQTGTKNSDLVSAAAPGQMAGHYAPRTPLLLVERIELGDDFPRGEIERCGWLGFRRDEPVAPGVFAQTEYLSEAGDLREAAASLFAALRRLDESGVTRIYAQRVPEDGLGKAIMERMTRAAAGSGR